MCIGIGRARRSVAFHDCHLVAVPRQEHRSGEAAKPASNDHDTSHDWPAQCVDKTVHLDANRQRFGVYERDVRLMRLVGLDCSTAVGLRVIRLLTHGAGRGARQGTVRETVPPPREKRPP